MPRSNEFGRRGSVHPQLFRVDLDVLATLQARDVQLRPLPQHLEMHLERDLEASSSELIHEPLDDRQFRVGILQVHEKSHAFLDPPDALVKPRGLRLLSITVT